MTIKKVSLAVVCFCAVFAGGAFAQAQQGPFKYRGKELTTAEMFWKTAYQVGAQWKKNNPPGKSERKNDPDVLMLLLNCVRRFPGDLICSERFVTEYEARSKERGFGGNAADKEAGKYLIGAFSVMIKHDPKNHYKYFARGLLYLEQKQYEPALSDFSNTIKFSKTPDAGDFNFRARAYKALNKIEPAIADYKKALSLRPGDTEAIMGLINIYLAQNKGDEAVALVTPIIDGNDEVKIGWFEERSRIYTAMKKYDLAMKDVDEMQKLDPDSTSVMTARGAVYAAQGKTEQAIAEFRKAYQKMPWDEGIKNELEKLGVKP